MIISKFVDYPGLLKMSTPAPDPLFVFRGPRSPVMSLTFLKNAEDGSIRYIAAGMQEGQVLMWDLKTKCVVREWAAHPGSSILWLHSRSAEELWTYGRHDNVKCWNISEPIPKVLIHYSLMDYLGFSQPDIISDDIVGLLAIPGPSQECVTVIDIEKQSKICSYVPHDAKKLGNLMQMKWVKGSMNPKLLVAYESGHILLWDYVTRDIISEVQCKENPICISFDSVSQLGMIGTPSEKVYIFHIDSDLKVNLVKEVCITNPGLASCIARPDGKIFVTGGWDDRIRLFSSKKMKPLAVLLYHRKTVECLAYSPTRVNYFDCDYLLAAGSSDMSVSLWNLFN